MSKQLSKQASELWTTVSAPETAETYTNALVLTWQIIKSLILTIWLTLCLVIVAADWIADSGVRSGRAVRHWLKTLQQQDSDKLASVTGEQLATVSKQSLVQTVAKARKQLGLPEKVVVAPQLLSAAPTASESSAASEAEAASEPTTAAKPEAAKPEAAKPEAAKSEATTKPEAAKSEAAAQPKTATQSQVESKS